MFFGPSGARTKNAQREKNDNLSVKNDTVYEIIKMQFFSSLKNVGKPTFFLFDITGKNGKIKVHLSKTHKKKGVGSYEVRCTK